jgi:hypothetical protein
MVRLIEVIERIFEVGLSASYTIVPVTVSAGGLEPSEKLVAVN